MAFLSSLGFWQYFVTAVTVVLVIWACARNRIVHGKLILIVALAALAALQLLKTPEPRETPRDAAIRQARSVLRVYADHPTAPEAFVEAMRTLDTLDTPRTRDQADAVRPHLEAIRATTFTQSAYTEAAETLVTMWEQRLEDTPEKLRAELATLLANPHPTLEEQRRIRMIEDILPQWYDQLPIRLGLDLRGGTEIRLLLRPDDTKLRALLQEQEAAVRRQAPEEELARLEAAIKQEREDLDQNFDQASDVIRERLNLSGLSEIIVTQQGNNRLLVQLPGMGSAQSDAIISRVRQLGNLEFRIAITEDPNDPNRDSRLTAGITRVAGRTDQYNYSLIEERFLDPEEVTIVTDPQTGAISRRGPNNEELYDWLHTPEGRGMIIAQRVLMTGHNIRAARERPSTQHPGQYEVGIWMNQTGSWDFERITRQHRHGYLAMVLDGELKSAPRLNDIITGGVAVITGNFTLDEAQNLAVVLKSGSLNTRVDVEFENTVGPTLGQDSIRMGLQAMLLGLASVILFMLLYYRVAGIVTDIILVLNMALILTLLSAWEEAALTLPGIAGLILTVGMAVDANVLIFERIREEREKGNSLARSLALGYERAFVTIIDANVTTFLTAVILHQFGTESVRGFALTLILGILCSVFTALVLTRWIFEALIHFRWITDLKMNRFFAKPSIPFTKIRRPAMILSAVCILAGMYTVGIRGEKNLSQEFTGGSFAHVSLHTPMTMEAAGELAGSMRTDFPDLGIQSAGRPVEGAYDQFLIRTARIRPDEESEEWEQIREAGGRSYEEAKSWRTADEFKEKLQEVFPLQADGLIIDYEKVADRSTADVAVFKVDLMTRAEMRPSELADLLRTRGNFARGTISVIPRSAMSEKVDAGSGAPKATLTVMLKTPEGEAAAAVWEADFLAALKDMETPLLDPVSAFVSVETAADQEGVAEGMTRVVYTLQLKEAADEEALSGLFLAWEPSEIALLPAKHDVPAPVDFPDDAVTSFVIYAGVPVMDERGQIQSDTLLAGRVRDQFRILRDQGALVFTEPFLRYSQIGRTVAGEMIQKALLALVYSMVVIFFYIWLRFQFRASFGFGAVLALVHDVLFTLGALAIADEIGLLNGQIDLVVVAALLTLVGYSLNDTIVVFDRIRENAGNSGKPLQDVIDDSINQTLARTVVTSMTTLLVVISLLWFGGEVIRGFAFSLFVGVLVGTYSSVFIASPILVEFAHMREKREARRRAARLAKTQPSQS